MICVKCESVNVEMKPHEDGDILPFCKQCEEFVQLRINKSGVPCLSREELWDGGDVGENKIIYKSGASRNDIGKIRLDLIPPEALLELGEVFGEGAVRHGDENWKKGMPNSVVINHMMRHLLLYMTGDRDEPHMGKVMFGCCVLIWNEENNIDIEE